MNSAALLICRRLLQVPEAEYVLESTSLSPTTVARDPTFHPSTAVRRPFNSSTHLDSSMALTILVLLTALFFMGFFSVYIRHFASTEEPSPPSPSPTPSSRRRTPPPNHKGGLDPSAVNALPLVAHGKAAKHRMIEECPICLSEFQDRESVKLIPYCGHVFHPSCIDTWLSSHVTCPLCRSAQLFKRVEEVCLDVKVGKNEFGASDIGERSTVENGNTWRDEGAARVRRVCSCPNLADRAVLQRSTSF